MKPNWSFYAVIALMAVVAAWLLAHPNLIGKLGILFYNYDMIKNLPRAIMTVGITVLLCAIITWGAQRTSFGRVLLAVLALSSAGLLVHTYLKFSSGSYALTGTGFKTGAVLVPLMMLLIFAEGLWRLVKR